MLVLRIEYAFNAAIQRSHDADARKHRPAMLCLHRGFPTQSKPESSEKSKNT
jgi:hypothetical protein